ncbi:hypothetical protein X777_02821 [Ooceraea biroi]|uniref:Peptidase A2 domain-containing protein n=1 Tax=Ooceraea biroi TaxID=2015173 RepID=A0A026X1L8_OOCBI|nr:hypothetical protein X777_02821 [Ooceraea biroi]
MVPNKLDCFIKRCKDYIEKGRKMGVVYRINVSSPLFQRNQKSDESFDDFITDLKRLSLDCAFRELKDSLIKDRIVSGIQSKQLKDRLLREDLTLDKAVRLCRAAELANRQLEKLNLTERVDVVQKRNNKRADQDNQPKKSATTTSKKGPTQSQRQATQRRPPQQATTTPCTRCGYTHPNRTCLAMNKTCNNCYKLNHFAKVCKRKNVNTVVENNDDDKEVYLLGNVDVSVKSASSWYEKVIFKDVQKLLNFKLDTGAGCNIISIADYKRLGLIKRIDKTTERLANYNGLEIPVIGKVKLECQVKNKVLNLDFFVANSVQTIPVLGLQTLEELELVKRIAELKEKNNDIKDLVSKYDEVFQGISRIAQQYAFKLTPGYKGKIEQCRNIPFKLQKQYKLELQKMEQQGIIKRVDEPTEFVNPVVIVRKPDKTLRICLDPKI